MYITPLPGNRPVESGAYNRDGASTELGPAPKKEALDGQTGRLQPHTARNTLGVIRSVMNNAIEDSLITMNPAAKLGQVLKLNIG